MARIECGCSRIRFFGQAPMIDAKLLWIILVIMNGLCINSFFYQCNEVSLVGAITHENINNLRD